MNRFTITLILLLYSCIVFAQRKVDVILLSEMPAMAATSCGTLFIVAKFNVKIKHSYKPAKLRVGDTVSFYVQCPGDYGKDYWKIGNEYQFLYETNYKKYKFSAVNSEEKRYRVIGFATDVQRQ